MRGNQKRRGWTLLELLVVIGIIGLLTGLLLPALAKAKEKTRLVQCRNNLRQIGIALRVYAGDHQGRLPILSRGSGQTGASSLASVLGPYTANNSELFLCPKDAQKNVIAGYSSYDWNFAFNGKLIDRVDSGRALAFEREDWHSGRGKNGVFADGRVDWAKP
jgi:prepilin-type N-terminal cleavage/methylation domain-containing protein/prepilin-type processing-associated H-X9-DG protein